MDGFGFGVCDGVVRRPPKNDKKCHYLFVGVSAFFDRDPTTIT